MKHDSSVARLSHCLVNKHDCLDPVGKDQHSGWVAQSCRCVLDCCEVLQQLSGLLGLSTNMDNLQGARGQLLMNMS